MRPRVDFRTIVCKVVSDIGIFKFNVYGRKGTSQCTGRNNEIYVGGDKAWIGRPTKMIGLWIEGSG